MATTQIQGMNILVYVKDAQGQKIALGGQKNCTLSMEADTIDVSNKNDFGWASFIAGARSWTVSCDGQFLIDDSTNAGDAGQNAIMKAFLNSDEVEIEMSNAVLGEGNKAKEATIAYTGKAVITSLELEAAFDDVFAYSVELQGKGPLTDINTDVE